MMCPQCNNEAHQVWFGDRFRHFRCMKCQHIHHECHFCYTEVTGAQTHCPKCGCTK